VNEGHRLEGVVDMRDPEEELREGPAERDPEVSNAEKGAALVPPHVARAFESEWDRWTNLSVIAARMAAFHLAPRPRGFAEWDDKAVRAVLHELKLQPRAGRARSAKRHPSTTGEQVDGQLGLFDDPEAAGV
jgi:hypothetical protein